MPLRDGRASEGFRPASRRELRDQPVRVRRHPQQHIFEVREGREVNQLAALDKRIEEGGAARAFETPGEEPVLATHRHHAQLVLCPVVVNGESAIIDEVLERGPLIRQIAHGVADR
jgi:hypothetical protein